MDGSQGTALPGGGSSRSSGLAAALVDVVDRLLDGGDLFRVFVRDLGLEFLFERHHEFNSVERVSAQVIDEGRLVRHLFLFDAQLLGDDRLHPLFNTAHCRWNPVKGMKYAGPGPQGLPAWAAYSMLSRPGGPMNGIPHSNHVHTAVDMQCLPGDVAGPGRCQEGHRMSDVFR